MKSIMEEYKQIYAYDLLVALGYEAMETRSEADIIEACEMEGFVWQADRTQWAPAPVERAPRPRTAARTEARLRRMGAPLLPGME